MSALTRNAVLRQLQTMQASSFDFAVRRENGPFTEARCRTLAQAAAPSFLAWLARENSLGGHIYVKPTPGPSFEHLLLDDLKPEFLAQLKKDRLPVSCIVQTSPGNYQAWLKFPEPMSSDEARGVARLLTRKYHADPACAAKSHFGRLAGFTNRKEKYRKADGRFPWVYLVDARDRMLTPEQQRQFLTEARSRGLVTPEVSHEAELTQSLPTRVRLTDAGRLYERLRTAKIARGCKDESAIDLSFCLLGLRERVPEAEIVAVLRQNSPRLEVRKAGHVEDYLARTLDKARQFYRQTPEKPERYR